MNKSDDPLDESMQILKTASCKSVSGKSTLTYQLGAPLDGTVHIRISKNTGNGFFNPEWIKIEDIQKALAKGHEGDPLTSFLLAPLFKGKSTNSPAFMVAALSQEKLLRVLKGKKRGHEFLDPDGFHARMQRLVSAKAKPKGTAGRTTRNASTKKTAIKKKVASRRKTLKTG